jgi:hypothetical protein
MKRVIAALLAFAVAGASALFAGVTGASASPAPCTVQAHFAARIAIVADSVKVPATLSGCTDGSLIEASADFYSTSDGVIDDLYYYRTRSAYLTLYAWELHPGAHRTIDGDGVRSNFGAVRWAYTTTAIKFGQRASLGASRTGNVVTAQGTISQFVNFDGFRGVGGHTAYLQQDTSHGWVTVGSARTNGAGKYVIHRTNPTAAAYRVITPDTAADFGTTSATVRR